MGYKNIKEEDVKFTVSLFPEVLPIEGNVSDSGNQETDRRAEQAILEDLKTNDWAWCCVDVEANCNGVIVTDALGGCTFKSQDDFESSKEFGEMKRRCIDGLNHKIQSGKEPKGNHVNMLLKRNQTFLGNLPIGDTFWIKEDKAIEEFTSFDRNEKEGSEINSAKSTNGREQEFNSSKAVYVIDPGEKGKGIEI